MLIHKEIEIDMGHRVSNHKGKCRNLHGHRYKIEVGVDDKLITENGASDEGMVIDFSDLKQTMIEEIDAPLDHGFMIYEKDQFIEQFRFFMTGYDQKIIIVPFVPTAENISKYLYQIMRNKLNEKGIKISYVKIYETPTSSAICTETDI
jgi:6-pyruvoyltetrahydropterin/6-carboxytetrahydropterin synthase